MLRMLQMQASYNPPFLSTILERQMERNRTEETLKRTVTQKEHLLNPKQPVAFHNNRKVCRNPTHTYSRQTC